jgi:hypothetical protein
MVVANQKSFSTVIFGTMRMLEVDRSVEDWADFLVQLRAVGIDTLHSSCEYESFPLLEKALRRVKVIAPQTSFRHIVKLADPSFDDFSINGQRVRAALEGYSESLGCDRIDDVQWMWRRDLKDEPKRLEAFSAAQDEIDELFSSLKESDKIGRFFCFPYSAEFAEIAIKSSVLDGLVFYRNRSERGFDAFLDICASQNKICIVIRPFLGGTLLKSSETPGLLFQSAIGHAAIEAGIVSSSSLAHLTELM